MSKPLQRLDVRKHIESQDLPDSPTIEDIEISNELDAVADLDLDPTGSEPIEDTINNVLDNGVGIHFPAGTYRLSGEIRVSDIENFGLFGEPGATLKIDSGITGYVVSYLGWNSTRNCAFTGFVIDQSADNCSAQTRFSIGDGGVVSDIEFQGYSDPDDSGKKLIPQVSDSDGAIRVEGIVATDGTEVGNQDINHNKEHKHRFDGGMWIGPKHEGTAYILDCSVAHWSDPGIYASRTYGGVVVAGGYFGNSSIAQVRLSNEDSFVGGGIEIEIDTNKIPEENNPNGLAPARGIWFEPGHFHGAQGATIGDCYLRLGDSNHVPGVITIEQTMGDANIVGPVDMEINGDHQAILARSPDGGNHRDPPPKPHTVRMKNVTITGDGDVSPALVDIRNRPDSHLVDSCIDHDGPGVNGVRFSGASGEVKDSSVNVSGNAVSGASTSNVSTSGTCELRSKDDEQEENDEQNDEQENNKPMSQTFHKAVDELNSKLDNLQSKIRSSTGDGTVVAEPGDFASLMNDKLEDGDRSKVKLVSGETYKPSETIPVPPKTTLDCNDARIEPAGNNDVLRPWPTAQIKDVEIDWSDTSGFDSVGILFLHDASLYNNDIPKPWDEPSPGPTRSWAHGRFGSVHDELDNISISGNRQGKALSLVCDSGGQGGIHFVTGSGIQTERVDTSVHLFREAGAFQNNANMFEIHSEDCRIGVHHEHDPENDDRSHINGNKYMMSWQPDGSQAFSEHAWLNEEGKNNAMHAHPFYWDLSSRHEEDIAPFIFKSPFPDKADFERSGRNAIVAPSNVRNYVEDEVTNMNYEHNRNRVVSLLHLGDIIQ